MKCLQVIVPLLGLICCTSAYFYEHTLSQTLLPIDQFDRRTWQNRFYLDDSYYTPGGPLFLSTGASQTFKSDDWLNHTHFFDMGREMNALLVYTEHRFYGESRPTEWVPQHILSKPWLSYVSLNPSQRCLHGQPAIPGHPLRSGWCS